MNELKKSEVNELGQEKLAQEILGALKGIRYGAVEIVIHDGQVTQIDRKERMRLPEKLKT